MARRSKVYREKISLVEKTKLYPLHEAVSLAKQVSYGKFSSSLDMAVNLGLDPRHADQNIRGAVSLPFGSGKVVRIVVFAKGQAAVDAKAEDVVLVGADDLLEKIQGGWLEFDQVVATPDLMGLVGRLGKVLGPRGLMPNPKMGTVTFDVVGAIRQLKAGRAEYRVDKAGIVHTSVGRVSMDDESLIGNIRAVMDALQKARPSTAKGTYIRRISLAATMGLGVKVDPLAFK